MPKQVKVEVLSHTPLGADYLELTVRAREIPPGIPGQFAALRVGRGLDPLLRRPLSIHHQDPRQGTLQFLYKVVGRGTRLLSEYGKGEEIDLIAPLGRGFSLEGLGPHTPALLVAGGVGAAPLHFLAVRLKERGIPVTFLLGGRSMEDLAFRDKLSRLLGEGLVISTEDGSLGRQGLVTGLIKDLPPAGAEGGYHLFACGPEPMLKETARLAREVSPHPLQFSLEAVMACGFGACLGCVCPASGKGKTPYLRVCTEGPVFHDGEVEL